MIPDWLQPYHNQLLLSIQKNHDRFETQLSYISAGALFLSLGFIKDIVKDIHLANNKWLLFSGWGLLTLTLLINCISHLRAEVLLRKTMAEIENYTPEAYDIKAIIGRYKIINRYNVTTIITMIIGIVAIVVFVSLNT